jgi:hypothetical protein
MSQLVSLSVSVFLKKKIKTKEKRIYFFKKVFTINLYVQIILIFFVSVFIWRNGNIVTFFEGIYTSNKKKEKIKEMKMDIKRRIKTLEYEKEVSNIFISLPFLFPS